MLTQLVKQVITSSFNGCYCRVRRFLNSHLTGGQTQVQLNDRHFVRMIFFQTSLEVYQLWTESLQALIQFFNQVIDFSFKIGRFVDSVTKVDVHIRPRERGADPLKLCFVLTSAILHPQETMQTKNALQIRKMQLLLQNFRKDDCNSEHGYGILHGGAVQFPSGVTIVPTSRR